MYLDKIFNRWTVWAPLPLRLAAGAIFTYHGYLKLFVNHAGTARFFDLLQIPAPEAMAWWVGLVELVGGLALILGWWVRVAALLLLGDMLVALFIAELPHGLTMAGTKLVFTLITLLLSLLFGGGGPWSLDKKWCHWCRI